ncbi:MAG: hypothetical protein Q8J67_06560 [Rhodocyclaceae bacterium]|jgi:uncharacterized low-complexity protein|nr:hypothetical protein [Rhodocyclaceae bacterium]MDP2194907.1 hypothetical protein [Rhodocyclaceae bacterium]
MKNRKTQLILATSVAFAATAALSPAMAADNPFGMAKLDGGYQLAQADKKVDGKCGEGKCGGDKVKAKADDKKKDGKCGEGKCGAPATKGAKADTKMKDGKCGEGKCGGTKK